MVQHGTARHSVVAWHQQEQWLRAHRTATDALQEDGCSVREWMLCWGMDAVTGQCSASPPCHAEEFRVSSGPAVGVHAVLPCWDAVISASTTSSPHVQPGKNASSVPWASQHPSKSRASIQGGERPLTHSPRRESAAGLGQEPRPDTSASSAMLLPGRILSPQGRNGLGEEGTAGSFARQELAVLASDRAQFTAASAFPQDPVGRKSRVGWGCWMREGTGGRLRRGRAACAASKQLCAGRKPCKRSRRAALARGSLMGHKFLLRIVAC